MEKEVLTAHEAAEYLGANVESIRRLARSGSIPSYKIGKDWRFQRQALRRWTQEHHVRRKQAMVLVVDSEPSVRTSVRKVIASAGYRVEEAADGHEALACVARETPAAILLDLSMPGMNGAELLEHIRGAHTDIPVVVLTGRPDGILMEQALRHGPITLVAKPAPVAQLLQAVGAALGRQSRAFRGDDWT